MAVWRYTAVVVFGSVTLLGTPRLQAQDDTRFELASVMVSQAASTDRPRTTA